VILVADFEIVGAKPSSRDLVEAAAAAGAAFVAVDAAEGDEDAPEAHLGGRRVATIERLVAETSKRGIGLFVRLRDTPPLFGLREALGVTQGASSAASRDRLVVVVDRERVGKRLRRDAPELPSALELASAKPRGWKRFATPNFLRAAADADDLVVPWDGDAAAPLVARTAPLLAKRGARLWVSGLSDGDVARVGSMSVAGCVVRRRLR
jgi:hypothetical protein